MSDKIKKQVEARVQEEAGRLPTDQDQGSAEPDLPFIWQCYRANEVGDSELYNLLNQGRFVYDKVFDRWLEYVGPHWDLDLNRQARAGCERVVDCYLLLIDELEQKIGKADQDEVKKLIKLKMRVLNRIERLRSRSGRISCISCATSNSNPLTLHPNDLDQHPLLLPVKNGVVDMRTGELRDGRPDDWLSMAAPVPWDSLTTPCPAFEEFLFNSLDHHQEKYDYLHRILGYAATGLAREAIFPVLYGKYGRNGKGTLLETMRNVLGEMASPIQSEMLLQTNLQRNSGGPSPDILALKAKRIVWGSEVEDRAKFAAGIVKRLTGGDTQRARDLHDGYYFEFVPTHTLFLLTNSKPAASATDNAFFERIRIIDFPLSFVPRRPDKPYERRADLDLREKLIPEYPGILAWLVRGYLAYLEEGLAAPRCVIADTLEYRRSEDIMQDFLDDCCEEIAEERTKFSVIYGRYKEWWEANGGGLKPFTAKRFGMLLRDKYTVERVGGNSVVYGLRVRINLN